MHEVVLLRARVEVLEEANTTISKRRRAKRTRLQEGGSLAISEGQAIVDQRDVNKQVVQEARQGSGRAKRTEVRERRCGTCSNIGHNARTCTMPIEVLTDDDFIVSS